MDIGKIEHAVRTVRNQEGFIKELLCDGLDWPIGRGIAEVEDIAYGWSKDDLQIEGMDKHFVDGQIWQIQPLEAGRKQPWGIFLLEFNKPNVFTSGRGITGPLRRILRRLVPKRRQQPNHAVWDRKNLLFICTHKYEHFSIAYFKEPPEGSKTAPLAIFGWGPDIPSRTAVTINLPALDWPDEGVSPDQWVANWAIAFDVEKVTRKFYEEYAEVFTEVEAQMPKSLAKGEERRLYTQMLMNRLMFLRFIERKGWLKLGKSRNYLQELFTSTPPKTSFYKTRLRRLFFEGLALEKHTVRDVIGDVPFLNGGLFEESPLDKKVEDIPNAAFEFVLGKTDGIFYHYNFTVEESTPLDIQVAVDPEMLGKVFEELVTGRHESGSYYTPRPVVSFMCREALKGYLANKTGASSEAIALLVDKHDVSDLNENDGRKVIEALDNIKAVDPACGSGAYLLGLLQEMVTLYRLLYSEKLTRDSRSLYELKLRIISNNLYGVDIDPFATNIAMLRLWLSIAVDSDKSVPLPNLDFKIETGDSLLGPCALATFGLDGAALQTRAELLIELKEKYLTAHGDFKENLRASIRNEEKEIGFALRALRGEGIVDWRVQFAEVFGKNGGFDIVLANPPYVRADAQFKHLKPDEKARQKAISEWKGYRKNLIGKKLFQTVYEKWDIFIPFLERAYQLLRANGGMVFIIPDAYNAAKYAAKSHKFFLGNAQVARIDFCSDIDLFDAGVNNTILYFRRALPDEDFVPIRVRRWGDKKDDFSRNVELLKTGPQQMQGNALFRPGEVHDEEMPDGAIPLGHICYISKGMVIHSDERGHQGEFTTEDVLSAMRDGKHPKRFVLGKDIMKWALRNVRFLEWGTARAPGLFSRPTFPELHGATEKLVAVRTPGTMPKVVYDSDSLHFDASSVGLVPWHLLRGVRNRSIAKSAKYRDELRYKETMPVVLREDAEELSGHFDLKYVLGVMNSAHVRNWLTNRRRSKLHVYPNDWKGLPIPKATPTQQQKITSLVQKCLEAKGEGCEAWEREIDEHVAALYGL